LFAGRDSVTSARDDWTVMASRLFEEARTMQDGAAFGVGCRKHQPRDTGQADSANTHGAGLQRHIKSGS